MTLKKVIKSYAGHEPPVEGWMGRCGNGPWPEVEKFILADFLPGYKKIKTGGFR